MLPLLLLLAAFPPPNETVIVRYSAPEGPGPHPVDRYTLDEREVGAVLYVGSDDANLRAGPRIDADVVRTLPLGTKVTVRARTERELVLDRVDRWYEVALDDGTKGHLFGNVLTRAAWRLDLDGDGDDEIVTATPNARFSFRVRVAEHPDEPTAKGRQVTSFDVEATGGAYVAARGGYADVKIRTDATPPLVEVWAHQEACADFSTTWVGYRAPRGKARAGELFAALRLSGIADAPMHSDYAVTFTRAGASVRRTESLDEESAPSETTSVYTRRDGVYVASPAAASK